MMVLSKFLRHLRSKSVAGMKLEQPSPDSIPYACHYSPETILTKNGELLQIIKLEDFHSDRNVREELRSSIIKNIEGDNFAITIHTIRRKGVVAIPWDEEYQHGFSYDLHQSWKKRKKSQVEYTNEIYISIIARGLKNKVNLMNLPLRFSFTYIKSKYAKHLAQQCEQLSTITDNILSDLKHFNAKKLDVDDDGNSELLQLFRWLITLLSDARKIALPTQDISERLVEGYFNAFGFNAFEISCNNKKKFASVLGVKRYREVNINTLSMAIQLDMEYIITEAIDLDHNVNQFKKIEYQDYLFNISNEQELKNITGLDECNVQNKCVNHCINIVPIANSVDELEESVSCLIRSLSECGLAVFRHDLSLASAFLNTLPANFAFKTLSYLSAINNIAGFALLHALNPGNIMCRQWGYAITLFWSIHDTPYFFNFHNDAIGHTTIIGPIHSGKTILQNFIISESKKIGTRIFIIDHQLKSKIFVNALNGEYKTITADNIDISYNPFQIEDSIHNRKFMCELIQCISGKKQDNVLVGTICDNIFSFAIKDRSLDNVHKAMLPLGSNINKWFEAKGFFKLLLEVNEQAKFGENQSIGFDIGSLTSELVIILVLIVLHKIEYLLDGTPAIIVLEEAWKMSGLFPDSNALDDFLSRMSKLNCVVIFTSSDVESILSSEFTKYLNKRVATQIFLPGNVMNRGYIKTFNITREDLFMIGNLQSHNRHFFLKQGKTSIVLKLDISDMIEGNVLSSNKGNIRHMEGAMAETGSKDANAWLPVFYNKIQQ